MNMNKGNTVAYRMLKQLDPEHSYVLGSVLNGVLNNHAMDTALSKSLSKIMILCAENIAERGLSTDQVKKRVEEQWE